MDSKRTLYITAVVAAPLLGILLLQSMARTATGRATVVRLFSSNNNATIKLEKPAEHLTPSTEQSLGVGLGNFGAMHRDFPQTQRCSTAWMQQYAQLEADMLNGRRPPRYLVSVAVEAGLSDRLTGIITLFWQAMLMRRSFKAITYGDLPSFSAICDSPFVNWTSRPAGIPEEAVEPLKYTYKGVRGFPAQDRHLPASLDPAVFQMLYLTNAEEQQLKFYQDSNITQAVNANTSFLMAVSNRGRSHALASNPVHRSRFWEWGVPPNDAFMCAFFFLCSPVAAIRKYYSRFWDTLRDREALTIGIQIRIGDTVFAQQEQQIPAEEAVKAGAEWFACAEQLEKAFATPGQKVLWFLNADSQQLRQAAKTVYGSKLITDDELKMTHPDCYINRQGTSSSQACEQAAMDTAFQHSLGSMLTFSMTQLHVITGSSGYGRLGAWLSGRWDNIYQVSRGQAGCTPGSPVPPQVSATHYSGV